MRARAKIREIDKKVLESSIIIRELNVRVHGDEVRLPLRVRQATTPTTTSWLETPSFNY